MAVSIKKIEKILKDKPWLDMWAIQELISYKEVNDLLDKGLLDKQYSNDRCITEYKLKTDSNKPEVVKPKKTKTKKNLKSINTDLF